MPGELARHTRHKLKCRRRPKRKPFPIADRTSIHSRPELADGKRFGDFEMDLIVDGHTHAIRTIVERSTNMLFMTKLPMGRRQNRWPRRSDVCFYSTRNTSRPLLLTMLLNLLHTSRLQKIWKRSSILQTPMLHGRKEQLRIQINSSGNASLRKRTSMTIQKKNC